jgi:hypothetical protein
MARFTFTLDDEQQAIAEEMASHKNMTVKDCLWSLLSGRIAHYSTVLAEQKWSAATPEQKQAALKTLTKGVRKDGNKKQAKTKKKAG